MQRTRNTAPLILIVLSMEEDMENIEGLGPSAFLMQTFLIVRAFWSLVVPVLLIIAARMLWRCTPKWIPFVFVGVAMLSVLVAISPPLLMRIVSIEQYSRMAVGIEVANQVAGILLAIAILALAARMKKMTEPIHAP